MEMAQKERATINTSRGNRQTAQTRRTSKQRKNEASSTSGFMGNCQPPCLRFPKRRDCRRVKCFLQGERTCPGWDLNRPSASNVVRAFTHTGFLLQPLAIGKIPCI